MRELYQNNPILGKLRTTYMEIFSRMSHPTATNLMLVCLSMLILNACPSVRFSHAHCIALMTHRKLGTLYHTLGKAPILRDRWWRWLLRSAVSLIPEDLGDAPVLFSIDDTIVGKDGRHFEFSRWLVDHSIKSGDQHVDGHCFAPLLLSVPVRVPGKDGYSYMPVPLLHRMWRKSEDDPAASGTDGTGAPSPEKETKLTIARDLVSAAVGELRKAGVGARVIVPCDSWYPKGPVLSPLSLPGVGMICAARIDTYMTEVPEPPGTRRRGRPRKPGLRPRPHRFAPTPVPGTDRSVGSATVTTRLFDGPVEAFVTRSSSGTRRLLLCTDRTLAGTIHPGPRLDGKAGSLVAADPALPPPALYGFRWGIETCLYELKTFWGMRDRRLLSAEGIENLLNLQLLNYSLMTLLPMLDPAFACLADISVQERRYTLGTLVNRLLIIRRLGRDGLDGKKSPPSLRALRRHMISEEHLSA